MNNKDIIDIYINNGLIKRCIDCQFSKLKDKGKLQYKDDFFNDVICILYDYSEEKIMDAHTNNHMNALITKIIINNIYSNTSPFYKTYLKFDNKTDEITQEDAERIYTDE